MDLRILIKNENGELVKECVVYRDGSDSEGAQKIVNLIAGEFDETYYDLDCLHKVSDDVRKQQVAYLVETRDIDE